MRNNEILIQGVTDVASLPYSSNSVQWQARKSVIGAVFTHANRNLNLIEWIHTPTQKRHTRDNLVRTLRVTSLHRVKWTRYRWVFSNIIVVLTFSCRHSFIWRFDNVFGKVHKTFSHGFLSIHNTLWHEYDYNWKQNLFGAIPFPYV